MYPGNNNNGERAEMTSNKPTSSVKDRTISILDRVDSPSGPSWSNLESDPCDLLKMKERKKKMISALIVFFDLVAQTTATGEEDEK